MRTLILSILLTLVSCNPQDKKTAPQTINDTAQKPALDKQKEKVPVKPEPQKYAYDGIPNFVVDDYPVTDEMFKTASYSKKSGELYDLEGLWFSNDTLKQTLVFVLYTDYHRLATYHFLNGDIPVGIIKKMELSANDGELAPLKLRKKHFKEFLAQSKKISQSYFKTNKGFILGDSKEKAIKVYGRPDKIETEDEVERYEWDFVGDIFYEKGIDLKGKPLAKDNYGHQVTMFFRGNKLTGIILHNDIP